MKYTIISASYANPAHTAATIITQEAGAVLASVVDTPELWGSMLASTVPAPYHDYLRDVPHQQAEMWERIKKHRDRLSDSGGYPVMVDGVKKWFHSDPKSKTQQLGLVAIGASVPPIPWKTMDGAFVPMTQPLALAILQSALQQDAAIFSAAETHKAKMMATTDPLKYEFTYGWPEMYGTG